MGNGIRAVVFDDKRFKWTQVCNSWALVREITVSLTLEYYMAVKNDGIAIILYIVEWNRL